MNPLVFSVEAFQRRNVKLVPLALTGAFAGDGVPQIRD
jgi:hypothetical protein